MLTTNQRGPLSTPMADYYSVLGVAKGAFQDLQTYSSHLALVQLRRMTANPS